MAAARILLVEDETLLRLVTAKRLRDDGFEVVAPRHGEESRAPLGDPDNLVARTPGNAGMQAQANALTGRVMAPDAIINELEDPVVAPASRSPDATSAADTGPIPLPASLDAPTIILLRTAA